MKVCTQCRFLQDEKNIVCYRCEAITEQWKEVCSKCGKPIGLLDTCYDCTYNKNTWCNKHSHFKPCKECLAELRKGMPIGL